MKLHTLLISCAFGMTVPHTTHAQIAGTARWADSASREIEGAAATGDLARMQGASALLERALTATPNDPLLLYYRALSLYRASSLQMQRKDKREANRALELADGLLERSITGSPTADALALRGGVLGQLIGMSSNPLTGMRLGPQASDLIARAMETGPNNPRVWLMRGISALFTPKMFGGGSEKAEQDLRKAVALHEVDNPARPAPSWGRADSYIWLGQALAKNGKTAEARAAYDKALALQPSNQWVLRTLIPALGGAKQ